MHPHKYSHSSAQWTTLALSPATNRLSPLPAADISKRVVWLFSECFFFRFLVFIIRPQHLAFAPSISVSPLLPPKDTAVSGIRPGCGLVLAGQWAMQAFFSPQWAPEQSIYPQTCSAGPPLPTLLIASDVLDSVQLTSKETRYIIVPRGTSGDQTYTGSVCSHQWNPVTSRWCSSAELFSTMSKHHIQSL